MLEDSNRIRFQTGFGTDWIASTCLLEMPGEDASVTESALEAAGVETRRWWGDGAHLHPATRMFPHDALPVTTMLARSTLSVPFYRDLDASQIKTVTDAIRAVVSTR